MWIHIMYYLSQPSLSIIGALKLEIYYRTDRKTNKHKTHTETITDVYIYGHQKEEEQERN